MKQLQKLVLMIFLSLSSSALFAQAGKVQNPNAIGTAGNTEENKELNKLEKNEQDEYGTSKAAKNEESLAVREKKEKERVEREKTAKEKTQKEKREKEKREVEKPGKNN